MIVVVTKNVVTLSSCARSSNDCTSSWYFERFQHWNVRLRVPLIKELRNFNEKTLVWFSRILRREENEMSLRRSATSAMAGTLLRGCKLPWLHIRRKLTPPASSRPRGFILSARVLPTTRIRSMLFNISNFYEINFSLNNFKTLYFFIKIYIMFILIEYYTQLNRILLNSFVEYFFIKILNYLVYFLFITNYKDVFQSILKKREKEKEML